MIMNLYGGTSKLKEGRYDLTQCVISEWALSSNYTDTGWGAWGNKQIQDKYPGSTAGCFNDNDHNAFYLGRNTGSGVTGWFKSRLTICMPSNLSTSGSKKLILKLRSRSAMEIKHFKALITTKNLAPTEAFSGEIASSFLWQDESKVSGFNNTTTSGGSDWVYFVFEYNFQPNTKYYIHILPYNSTGTAVEYPNNWCKFCNYAGYSYFYLDGKVDGS